MYILSAFHIVKVICMRFSIALGMHWLITISEKLSMISPPFRVGLFFRSPQGREFFPLRRFFFLPA